MKHRTFSKLIVFQASITFLDGKASSARKDPLVAFLETDAAVAFCDRSEFWDLDAEFEGTAVAVALVPLELWSGVWFRHWRNGLG
jgi:hypothetical protein